MLTIRTDKGTVVYERTPDRTAFDVTAYAGDLRVPGDVSVIVAGRIWKDEAGFRGRQWVSERETVYVQGLPSYQTTVGEGQHRSLRQYALDCLSEAASLRQLRLMLTAPSPCHLTARWLSPKTGRCEHPDHDAQEA